MPNAVGLTAFERTDLGAAVVKIGRDGIEACGVDYATLVNLVTERLALMVIGPGSELWRLRLTRVGLSALVAIELKHEIEGRDPA